MKRAICFLSLILVFQTTQAGIFSFLQNPPISFSMKVVDGELHVTNTSDDFIHDVIATSLDNQTTVVLADTIEPHKTVTFPITPANIVLLMSEFKVTCKGYGSMKVKVPVQ